MDSKTLIYIRWAVLRLALMLFDILAINGAFFLALVIRFYVGSEFHFVAGPYLSAFYQFAPFYTALCLLVFAGFKLYSSIWKYAGLNDLNRILIANLICFAVQVVGSLLFVQRMPVTYYVIGGMLQFFLTAAIRFSPRILTIEGTKLFGGKNNASLNAMVIGSGENVRMIVNQLDHENIARAVCVVNYKGASVGTLLDGIPVVNGLDALSQTLEKYQVNLVIIADSLMPQEIRKEIKETCKARELDVQDFSGYFQDAGGSLTLKKIAEYTTCPVEIVVNGTRQKYADGEQALLATSGKYVVKSIGVNKDALTVELSSHAVVLNDLDADWVKNQQKETGEEISFF